MRAGIALAILIGTALPALADEGFDIVIPGRPGVPIIINGIDASYAVVEGDWGLGKGVHVQPTIYGGRYVDPAPNVGHYYPSAGIGRATAVSKSSRPPTAGCRSPRRAIINPGRRNPPRRRQQPEIPFFPPPVIVAPQNGDAGMPQDFSNPPQDFRHRRPRNIPH